MKLTNWLHYLWKVPLCGLLFFLGFIPGGQLATWVGISAPELPVGADQTIIAQYTLLGCLILALGLATISRGISGGYLSRWLTLFFFTWITYGINNYLEASIFSTMASASLYTVVLYLPAALLCSAVVAWLFPASMKNENLLNQIRTFFAGQTTSSWGWRFLAAFLAFPLVYTIFGGLISPIVLPYYLEGTNELALPGWDQILPVLALRSLFFLLACLPILITWKLSNRHLFLTLGPTLFLFVGGVSMLYAYWLPPVLRITHGLEIFADEMVYAAALILLLVRHGKQHKTEQVLVPSQ